MRDLEQLYRFHQPVICFRFDGNYKSVYSLAYPLLKAADLRGIIAINTGFEPFTGANAGMWTIAELQEMLASGIMEAGSHTHEHYSVGLDEEFDKDYTGFPTPLDESDLDYQLSTVISTLAENGITDIPHIAYPGHRLGFTGIKLAAKYHKSGSSSSPVDAVDAQSTLKQTGNYGGPDYNWTMFQPSEDIYNVFRFGWAHSTPTSIADNTSGLNGIQQYCSWGFSFWHNVAAASNAYGHVTAEVFTDYVAQIVSRGILCVTSEEMRSLITRRYHPVFRKPVDASEAVTKGFNFAIYGECRTPVSGTNIPGYATTARLDRYYGWAARTDNSNTLYAYHNSGGPISDIDGKACGYISMAYHASRLGNYHQCKVPGGAGVTLDGRIPVLIRFKARNNGWVGTNGLIRLSAKNAAGNLINGTNGIAASGLDGRDVATNLMPLSSDWTQYQFKWLMPANAYRLAVSITPQSTNANYDTSDGDPTPGYIDISDLQIFKITEDSYDDVTEGVVE